MKKHTENPFSEHIIGFSKRVLMKLINEYDIDINFSTAKGTYSFDEYLDNIYDGNNIFGEPVRKVRNTNALFLPPEYQRPQIL